MNSRANNQNSFTNGNQGTSRSEVNDALLHTQGFLPLLSASRPAAPVLGNPSNNAEESDDDMEWEEIDIMQDNMQTTLPTQAVEVIIEDMAKNQK